MNTLPVLLALQGVLGALDNIWHHELQVGLPRQAYAKRELMLHALRSFLYVPVFLVCAWIEPRGFIALTLCALLLLEIIITLADFVQEDRTRALPATERVLHTLLALNWGAVLSMMVPLLIASMQERTSIRTASQGWWAWVFTLYALGALAWSVRDGLAARRLARPQLASWQRNRLEIRRSARAQSILIAGATGFIGRILTQRLIERGHRVSVLARNRRKALDLFGPHARIIEALDTLHATERFDVVINLAGEPVAGARWSPARKAVLVESRIGTTRMLTEWMSRLSHAPALLINASAIGFYGTHRHASYRECDPAGGDFPATLCKAWEREAARARRRGTRVVLLRLGLVLGSGGLMQRLLPIFRLGLGAPFGDGRQWMSWVHVDDVIGVIERILSDTTLSGAINVVAPQALTHGQFANALSRACNRPLWPAIPSALLRAALGEAALIVLEGQRVIPERLLDIGYAFRYPSLDVALHALLRSPRPSIASEVQHA